MNEWQALAAGFAFYLILEGFMPFFNPAGLKRLMALLMQMSDQQLRRFGAVMMLIGVGLLFYLK